MIGLGQPGRGVHFPVLNCVSGADPVMLILVSDVEHSDILWNDVICLGCSLSSVVLSGGAFARLQCQRKIVS